MRGIVFILTGGGDGNSALFVLDCDGSLWCCDGSWLASAPTDCAAALVDTPVDVSLCFESRSLGSFMSRSATNVGCCGGCLKRRSDRSDGDTGGDAKRAAWIHKLTASTATSPKAAGSRQTVNQSSAYDTREPLKTITTTKQRC